MPFIRHTLSENVPDFVQAEYKVFVELLELYYEWLFTKSNAKELIDFHRYVLADDSLDDYIERIKEEFGIDIPIHKSFSNKQLISYYLNFILKKRGTEAAIKAFFKLSFDEDVVVDYPYQLLFMSSNTEHSILSGMLLETQERVQERYYSLKGFSSGSYGDIERVHTFKNQTGKQLVYVEFITTDTFKIDERIDLIGNTTIECKNIGVHNCKINDAGKFYKKGDIITFNNGYNQGTFKVTSIHTKDVNIDIVNAGKDYKVGDNILTIPNKGFFAKVKKVDNNGGIEEINIINNTTFEQVPEKVYVLSTTGSGADLKPITLTGGIKSVKVLQPPLGATETDTYTIDTLYGEGCDVTLYKVPQLSYSEFSNNNHKLALNDFIIDSEEYHNHSYTITTPVNYKYWHTYMDKYLHRTGYVYKHVNPITSKTNLKVKMKSKVL